MTRHLRWFLLAIVICGAFLHPTPPTHAYSEGTYAISISPDNRYAAAGWIGGTALIYEIATASRVATLDCETDHVFGFGWSNNGDFLACGGYLGAVLFDTQTWSKVRSFPATLLSDFGSTTGDVYVLGFTPDDSTLLMGGPSGAWIWDIATSKLVHHLSNTVENDETRQFYESVVFSPNGRYVTVEGYGENSEGEPISAATLWDVQTGAIIHTFDPTDLFGPQPFSSDSTRLLVGGTSGLRLWDIASGEFVQTVDNMATGWGVFSSDSTRISRTFAPRLGAAGSFVLLNASTGSMLRHYGPRDGLLSPDGKWIVTLEGDAINSAVLLEVWDAQTGNAVHQLEPSITYTTHLFQFSPDSHYLLTGGLFGGAAVWDVQSGELLFEFSEA